MLKLLKKTGQYITKAAAVLAKDLREKSKAVAQENAVPGPEKSPGGVRIGIVREQFAASVVLVLGVALSAVSFLTTQHYFRLGEQREFDKQAAHYTQTVVNSMRRYEEYVLDLFWVISQNYPF